MPGDIIKTSFSFYSQCSAFRYSIPSAQQKTLLTCGKQGLEILFLRYLLTFNLCKLASFTFDAKDSPGPNP